VCVIVADRSPKSSSVSTPWNASHVSNITNRQLQSSSLPLPPGCNVGTGRRCRLQDGTVHPAVALAAAEVAAALAASTAIDNHPSTNKTKLHESAPRSKNDLAGSDAALLAGADLTDDTAAGLVVNWDARHREVHITWEPSGNSTDWVALLASKGHPPSAKCKLPPPSQGVPLESPLVVLREPRPALRIAWFFVLGFQPSPSYEEMLKSVVLSGRLRAPALEPYFLYIMNKVWGCVLI
jgi:hypothetical protein